MNREKIENVLLNMGVPAGNKGFEFIVDAVEYINKHGSGISVTKELYPDIAKRRNTTASRVERAIRHAFEIARSSRGDYEKTEKYIGFMGCSNFNSLVMLQKRIRQECAETENDIQAKQETLEQTAPITALEIREIFRQELRMALNDLKEARE